MIVRIDEDKLNKFKKDCLKKTNNCSEYENFCMYVQMAECCDNGLTLSRQPWRYSKFHKLSGDKANLYAFGISKSKRTLCYAQHKMSLALHEVIEIEVAVFSTDYH